MTTPHLYQFPFLHPALVSGTVPPAAATIPCGLEGSLPQHPLATPFPFPPRAARQVLREMLELGQELGHAGAASRTATGTPTAPPLSGAYEERTAVEAFAASGTFIPRQQPEEASAEALMDAQKVLLLSWQLEEDFLEMQRLQTRVLEADATLRANLGQGERVLHSQPGEETCPTEQTWQNGLEAACAFVAETAIFITHVASIGTYLHEAFPASLLPAPVQQILGQTAKNAQNLHCVHAPLWQIVGKKQAIPGRPWLVQERTIVYALQADS